MAENPRRQKACPSPLVTPDTIVIHHPIKTLGGFDLLFNDAPFSIQKYLATIIQ
jgi:hypothetical protein